MTSESVAIELPRPRRSARFIREGEHDLLLVSSSDGHVEMEVRFTEAGPVLRFPSASIRLESDQDVNLVCRDFRVRAGGVLDLEAGSDARVRGHGVEIESSRTDVRLKANDDVRLDGERILLNC